MDEQGEASANNMVLAQEGDKKFPFLDLTPNIGVGITMNPFTKKIYVANQYSNTVSVFDAKTHKLIITIQTGIFPYSIDANQFNNRIYVTKYRILMMLRSLMVLQIQLLTILLLANPRFKLVVDQSSNWVYVTNIDSSSISVIDGITNKVLRTISGISTPYLEFGIDPSIR